MKTLLQPEKLFSLTMWLVAILFAWFLMGFGGLIIRDLPLAEHNLTPEQFATPQFLVLKQTKKNIEIEQSEKSDQRDLLQQSLSAAQSQYDTEHVNFQNWLATRAVTNQSDQNPELIARTKRLEELKVSQVSSQQKIADLDHQLLVLSQRSDQLYPQYTELEQTSNQLYDHAVFKQQLKVFGYRLLFILPLIAAALWLFVRHRKSKYWPFVWGFIFFALFRFFVALVPYLPSQGG
ncbi:MAG: serine endopeptidase, partial [Candidatus Saccharibacteria bacterium]|nr:serine endopeptidase [Moraxellaceae bacterium]